MDVLETARKILLLEQREGFRDRAVVGGLDGFLEQVRLVAMPTLQAGEQRQLHEVIEPLEGYSRASQRDRREMLEAALGALGQALVERRSASKSPSPAAAGEGRGEGTPRTEASAPRPTKTRTKKPSPAPSPVATGEGRSLDLPIESVPGVASKTAANLRKLGIERAGDLLEHYPFRHMDRSQITPIGSLPLDQEVTVLGTVWSARTLPRRGKLTITEAVVADSSGRVVVKWFNQPWLKTRFAKQPQISVTGKAQRFRGQTELTATEWEEVSEADPLHTGRIVPVYHLTEGIGQKQLRAYTRWALDNLAPRVQEFLPERVRREANLMGLAEAMLQYHFPDSWSSLQQAERRLAFDELFLIQLNVLQRRRLWQEGQPGIKLEAQPGWLEETIARLPFELTSAQRKVLVDLLADMRSGRPMNRLVQGDVGSGKTVVAALAMLLAACQGYQSLLMAPTEILAEQHYRSISALFDQLAGGPFQAPRVALLTGSVKGKARADVLDGLKAGSVAAAIGTQALIATSGTTKTDDQESMEPREHESKQSVKVNRLGLAVVDEQHRFGVEQRGSLRQKGFNPHLLVMTATPIPRTLGLTIYGDLDISVIDEMPPGRQPVKTKWFGPEERQKAYGFIRRQVQEGRQAFVICPLIEESEKMEVRAATAEYERLRRLIFPELKLGLLHGRLKNREKDAVMQAFAGNEMQILVSTSVVEVGIDVPNATVMAIEGAERFGLAQLHQFRGRVGRGAHQSYCMLLSDSPAQELNPRLRAIEETHSGFRLAEIDLELRGPGELFGKRQSGQLELKVAKLTDVELIEESRRIASSLLDRDPDLAGAPQLRERVASLWQGAEVS